MSAAKRQKKNGPQPWGHDPTTWEHDPSTAAQDRDFDVYRMGKIADGIKFMYESGQLDGATFTERQQNISEYVFAMFQNQPGLRVETIVGFIMYGAGLSLTVWKGQLFMNDMIYYVAANFYAPVPRWENDPTVAFGLGVADEFIVHLQNRLGPYDSLQRYELNTIDYDALWAKVIFGGGGGSQQKNGIEKLLASGIGFTTTRQLVRRVNCEIKVGPPLLEGIPYFQAPGAKWSCGGPPMFSFKGGTLSKIPIFNRRFGNKLPLMQTVLLRDVPMSAERVQAWLQECGSAMNISSDDDANEIRDRLFASTGEQLQTFLGLSPVAAKMAHAQLHEQQLMALPSAISAAHLKAAENRRNGRKTPPWQAELMVLYELYAKSPEYPKIYLALDSDRKQQATDEVLRGIPEFRDTGPEYPQYKSIIDHYNIKIVDVDAQLGEFPPIVREILKAERDVTRLFHLRVRRDWRTAIRQMLAIVGARVDRTSLYWLSVDLLELISDWYMHGSLEASGDATMRATLDLDAHESVQKALTSIFHRKVSLEVMNDAKGVLAPLSIVPDRVKASHNYVNAYDAANGYGVVTFLNAVFTPLHNLGKRPERLDVLGLTFTALLDKLGTIKQEDLSGDSLQTLPAEAPDWIKHEYGVGAHSLPVYDIFTIFRKPILMNKLLILCGHIKPNVEWVLQQLQAYHAKRCSIKILAYNWFAEMLLEEMGQEWALSTSEDDKDDDKIPPESQKDGSHEYRKAKRDALQLKENEDDIDTLLLSRRLQPRIRSWLERYTLPQETPLRADVDNPEEREKRLVAFLLICSQHYGQGRFAVDTDKVTMGPITVDGCLDECMDDFRFHVAHSSKNDFLLTMDPLHIAKHICARPLQGMGSGPNRVDFTVPETNGSVTGHFLQSNPSSDIWAFRLFTKGMIVNIDGGRDPYFLFRSSFTLPFGTYSEYALTAATGSSRVSDIWKSIQDCTIWNEMSLNKDAHIKAMKNTARPFNKKHGGVIDFGGDYMDNLFDTEVAPSTVRDLIEPMFTAAAKVMLSEKVAAGGNVYMRASFTDLAIAA